MLKVTIKGENTRLWLEEKRSNGRCRQEKVQKGDSYCKNLPQSSQCFDYFFLKSVFSNPDHGLKMLYVLMWRENLKAALVNLLLSKSPRSDSKD